MKLDFTNSESSFSKVFEIPFKDGINFDETGGSLIMVAIKKSADISYALEIQFDVPS
jgi:hypothetical protein